MVQIVRRVMFDKNLAGARPFMSAENSIGRIPFLIDRNELHNVAILLDVDGTILDLASRWDEVAVPGSLVQALRRVSAHIGGALALVSGRPLADLDRLFSPLRLPAIGGHGAEIRPSLEGAVLVERATPLDRDLKRRLRDIAERYPGVVAEDKGYSLALHYRLAEERELDVIRDVFSTCMVCAPQTYELLTGKAVIEVKAAGFDKGTAIRELMIHPPFAGRRPIFFGDDTTDEAAFSIMPEFHGVAVSVGRRIPGALEMFETPSDVRRWLEILSNDLASSDS
jgi:trehalose 6-phosphate phosphatase